MKKNKTRPVPSAQPKQKEEFLRELDNKDMDKINGGWTPCQCGPADDQGPGPWSAHSSCASCGSCGGGWW